MNNKKKGLQRVLLKSVYVILPFIESRLANNKLRKRIEKNNENKISDVDFDDVHLEALKEDYNSSIDRSKRLEDKAKSLLIAWTISITLIFNLPKFMRLTHASFMIIKVNIILSIATVLYMILAGIMVTQVLTAENVINVIGLQKRDDKEEYYRATLGNNYRNLIRNNNIVTAYRAVINSFICLGIIFLMNIFSS
jgi:hypothetical protein